jgi:ribosomal protein S18 acetylase RimI-like enzyme
MIESQVTLRKAVPEDLEFLARLYFDTRRREVSAWAWSQAQQEMFLRMQFDAQRQSYRAAFPAAVDRIVCIDGAAAGRILVDRETAGTHLIDIAVLEDRRNRGVGTHLLRQVLEECKDRGDTLRLRVLQGNPAIRLYRRLGFVQCGADTMYVQMECTPRHPPERL